jgi:hypothetical protein
MRPSIIDRQWLRFDGNRPVLGESELSPNRLPHKSRRTQSGTCEMCQLSIHTRREGAERSPARIDGGHRLRAEDHVDNRDHRPHEANAHEEARQVRRGVQAVDQRGAGEKAVPQSIGGGSTPTSHADPVATVDKPTTGEQQETAQEEPSQSSATSGQQSATSARPRGRRQVLKLAQSNVWLRQATAITGTRTRPTTLGWSLSPPNIAAMCWMSVAATACSLSDSRRCRHR